MTTEQIIQRIIDQEIYTNASTMVTELLQDPDGRYVDDLAPCLDAPDYSEPPEGYEVSSYTTKGLPGVPESKTLWQWASQGDSDDGYDTEEQAIRAAWAESGADGCQPFIEALQFWLVSDWLASKLEQIGAPVAHDVLGFNVWGRTECGQSLTMDSALNAVARLIQR